MENGSLENIIYNILCDSTYTEISSLEMSDTASKLSIWNAEYRIIHAKERMDAFLSVEKKQDYNSIMKKFLASANGSAAYNIEIKKIVSRLKEYKDTENLSESSSLVPMTLIAYKIVSGHVFCSVERVFCKGDPPAAWKEDINNNLYMEQAAEIAKKFEKEKYESIGAIGKGDFTKPIKKVFNEKFKYILL